MESGTFQWKNYGYDEPAAKSAIATFGELVAAFERDYFQRRKRTRQSESTYLTEYEGIFRRLPADREINLEIATKVVTAIEPDTRQRKRAAFVLDKLLKFAGRDTDLKRFQGSYSPRSVKPRDLPSDELILEWRDRIPNDRWRDLFIRIVVYGLRPSEAMFCSIEEGSAIATVTAGKTGSRQCLPLRPEWYEEWGVAGGKMPSISGKHNRDLSDRIGKAFRRYEIPFRPYDLRHAYARRALEMGVSTTIAAQSMGHDTQTHQRIYRRWIQTDTFERIYSQMLGGKPHRDVDNS